MNETRTSLADTKLTHFPVWSLTLDWESSRAAVSVVRVWVCVWFGLLVRWKHTFHEHF